MGTTKAILTLASYAAILAALVATSGLVGPGATQALLACGAIIALGLTRAPHRQ